MAEVASHTAPEHPNDPTISQTGKSQDPVEGLKRLLEGLPKDANIADAKVVLKQIVDALEHASPEVLDSVGKDTWDRILELICQWIKHPKTAIPTVGG